MARPFKNPPISEFNEKKYTQGLKNNCLILMDSYVDSAPSIEKPRIIEMFQLHHNALKKRNSDLSQEIKEALMEKSSELYRKIFMGI